MKVQIYASGGDKWIAGIQYAHNLVRALGLLPKDERPEIVVTVVKSAAKYARTFAAYPHVRLDGPVDASLFAKAARIAARLAHRLGGPAPRPRLLSDACTVSFPAKVAGLAGPSVKIAWIPDFQYKRLPDLTPESDHRFRDKQYADLLAGEPLLVLSSDAVRADFEELFPGYRNIAVRILRFASLFDDADFAAEPRRVADKYELPEKYVCVPNQMSLHKGHDTAFEAAARLKEKGIAVDVVCTGSPYDYRTEAYFKKLKHFLAERGIEGQVRILGLLPRFDQIQIMREAALILQASRFEGWSTVIEDARSLGKSVLCSDLAVHKEQNPPHTAFFRTGDAADLAAKLEPVWKEARPGVDRKRETEARAQSLENGRRYAREFMVIAAEADARFRARNREAALA